MDRSPRAGLPGARDEGAVTGEPLRVGVIGLGFGANHARVLNEIEGVGPFPIRE